MTVFPSFFGGALRRLEKNVVGGVGIERRVEVNQVHAFGRYCLPQNLQVVAVIERFYHCRRFQYPRENKRFLVLLRGLRRVKCTGLDWVRKSVLPAYEPCPYPVFQGRTLMPVFLLVLFSKGDRANLSQAECNKLRSILGGLAADYRARVKRKMRRIR